MGTPGRKMTKPSKKALYDAVQVYKNALISLTTQGNYQASTVANDALREVDSLLGTSDAVAEF